MPLMRLLQSAVLAMIAAGAALAPSAHATGHSFWPLGAEIAALGIRPERPPSAVTAAVQPVDSGFWPLAAEIAVILAPPDLDEWLSPLRHEGADARAADPPSRPLLSPVQMLTALADGLRDIRYRRGGRDPSSGFDCSGFVRYVFRHGLGVELPHNSAAQSRLGRKLDRDELRSGDLVFFRTSGKGISHVGIYLDEGRFIHAPSSGKTVSISRLGEPYWAKRYAGARRPEVLVGEHAPADAGSS